ncbi:intraflagellar transport protein 22 homolog [Gouania willdenowi]|uniref:intraflagellar transport protein 22 homolog n=1 Tax=Gouania willdenowi TaxID=441366 RepID=UPI001054ED04|nr:intraflagellar transport protein 22 homolog [Gouania willdenowi]
MVKLKILIVGPCQSGKTVLANFLSDTTERLGGEYRPTQGVRMVSFECDLESSSDHQPCEVTLWDCSGNFKFESCWPALTTDSCGVVLVYNPTVPSQLREIESWFSMFVSSQGLQDTQCVLVAHRQPGDTHTHADTHSDLASPLSSLMVIQSNLEENPEAVRQHFYTYLQKVVKVVTESRERDEMSIIT